MRKLKPFCLLSPSTFHLLALYVFPSHLNESPANHGLLADGAEEALVVPGQLLKGYKLRAPQAILTWKSTLALKYITGRTFVLNQGQSICVSV